MSRACPDPLVLRIFAEGVLQDGELDDPATGEPVAAAAVTAHVARCEACRRIVERARREEAVLRGQLAAEMPAGLHAQTVRALDQADPRAAQGARRRGSSHRSRRSRARGPLLVRLALSLALLAAAGVAVSVAFKRAPAPDVPEPPRLPAPPRPAAKPAAPAPSEPAPPEVAPPRSDSPAHSEPADPGPLTRSGRPEGTPRLGPDAPTPPAPSESPVTTPTPGPVAPRPETPLPAPSAEREVRALAVARSGKLTVKGKPLAAGEALPEGETVEVGSSLAELESENAAKVLVASGARLSVTKGAGGAPVFFLAAGKLLATTAGSRPYTVATADARSTPHGTSFVVAIESGRTRVSTLEGRVRIDIERAPADAPPLDVRAGFEAEVAKGKTADAPRPSVPGRAVAWLPEAARPKALVAARVVRAFGFEDGQGFTQGTIVAGGAHGSRHALRGVTTDEGALVELADERVAALELDPALWVEVHCKASRAATVLVEVGPAKKRPRFGERGFEHRSRIEAGQWVTIAVPLRDFSPAGPGGAGAPGGPGGWRGPGRRPGPGAGAASEKMGRFAVVALGKGEPIELLVDDVRFYHYDE